MQEEEKFHPMVIVSLIGDAIGVVYMLWTKNSFPLALWMTFWVGICGSIKFNKSSSAAEKEAIPIVLLAPKIFGFVCVFVMMNLIRKSDSGYITMQSCDAFFVVVAFASFVVTGIKTKF